MPNPDLYLINESPTGEAAKRQAMQRLSVLLNGLIRLGDIVQHGDRHFHQYAHFRDGSGAPDVSLGFDGDYYLDDVSNVLYLKTAAVWNVIASLGGTGGTGLNTVCMNLPAELLVTPSCVDATTPTFAVTWATQTANKVLASPNGSSGVPGFRKVVGADLTTNTVPLDKLVQVPGFYLVGNPTGSTGNLAAMPLGGAFAVDVGTGELRTVAFTGDITIAANSTTTVLATVNSNVGTFGAASKTLVVAANGKGLITGISETSIAIAYTQVSGLATVAHTGSASDITTGTLPAAQLPDTGTAGTYTVVTTDAHGRVSSGSVTTLTAGTGLTGAGTLDADRTVSFAAISDANLLGNISGGSAAPTPHTLSAYVNALLSPTTGDVFVWNAGVLGKVSPGAANTALVSNGAGTLPSFKAASIGGTGTITGTYTCDGAFSGTINPGGLTIVWT